MNWTIIWVEILLVSCADRNHSLEVICCKRGQIQRGDRTHLMAVIYYMHFQKRSAYKILYHARTGPIRWKWHTMSAVNRLRNLHHTRTRSNLCGQKKSADLHAHYPKQSLKAFRKQSREVDWCIPSGHGKWTDILVQSSRNSKWLALSARESERFYARLLSQSELGSPHAVVVAANTLQLIGR